MTEEQAALFGKAVGDITRQHILRYCCCEKKAVGEIADHVGVTQPTATHHLSILEKAELVTKEKDGKMSYYVVNQSMVASCCGGILLNIAPNEEATKQICSCYETNYLNQTG